MITQPSAATPARPAQTGSHPTRTRRRRLHILPHGLLLHGRVPARRRRHAVNDAPQPDHPRWKSSLFGHTHAHGMEGVHFFTRGKVVTSRWLDPSHGGLNLGIPPERPSQQRSDHDPSRRP
jgi:hypothetical protein